jgi:hypothetical protein
MALVLRIDPTPVVAGAARIEAALDGVKASAIGAESAIDAMAQDGGAAIQRFDATVRGGATAMGSALAATSGATRDFTSSLEGLATQAQLTDAELSEMASHSAQFNALRSSLDPLYAASMRYESAVEQVNAALRAQVITQAEASRVLGLAEGAYLRAGNAAASVGTKSAFAANGGVRMLGQQISQVAQQGAATGQWMQALSIQAADIGMAFGGVGIAIGILATVGMPLLMQAMGGAESAADRMADAQDRLADSVASLRDISTELNNLDALEQKYGEIDARLIGLIERQREFHAEAARGAARDAISALADEYGVASGALNLYRITGKGAAADLAESLGLTKTAMVGLQDAIRDAQTATTFEEQADALARVDGWLQKSTISTSDLAKGVGDAALEMLAAEKAASDSADAVQEATKSTAALANGVKGVVSWYAMVNANVEEAAQSADDLANANMASAIAAAAGWAKTLWDRMAGAAASGSALAQYNRREEAMRGALGRGQTPSSQEPIFRYGDGTAFDPTPDLGGGGGGGGTAAIDDTRNAYDRLMASLDPVVARTQDMAEATAVVDAALAAQDITAAEHARALDLITDKYMEATSASQALQDAGANAIDGLIDGTLSLSEALKQMAKDLIFATIKAQLLNNVTGANAGMSLGGIIMAGITGGFHDSGGTIPLGTTGMVGERGPELVRATSSGAMVTSRVDTARQLTGAQNIHVTVSVDDDGKVKAYVSKAARAAAQAGASEAIGAVRRSLGGWNTELQTNGALV